MTEPAIWIQGKHSVLRDLNASEFAALYGLANMTEAWIGATEYRVGHELELRGLVLVREVARGEYRWSITEKGRAELDRLSGKTITG